MKGRICTEFCQYLSEIKCFKNGRIITSTHTFIHRYTQRFYLGIAKFKYFRKLNRNLEFSDRTTPYITTVVTFAYILFLKLKKHFHRIEKTSKGYSRQLW